MKLTPGMRLQGGDRSTYVLNDEGKPIHGQIFFRARKLFWNYRDRDRSLYEAPEDEGLAVLVRAPGSLDGPGLDGDAWRKRLDEELRHALNLPDVPGLPEPLDVLNWRESTPAGDVDVPLLILSDPHGQAVSRVLDDEPRPHLPRVCHELLLMIDALDRNGMDVVGLDHDAVFLDEDGRWTYLGPLRHRSPGDPGTLQETLLAWSRFCQPIADRSTNGEEARWLRERLHRLSTDRPLSASELLRESSWLRKRWETLRERLQRGPGPR